MKTFILSVIFSLVSLFSNSQLIDPIIQEQAIQQMEISNLQERLNLSSYYQVKSANQRNLALVVGFVGGIVSSAIITSNIKDGYGFIDRPFGYILGTGTVVTFSLLTISANINQKESGIALRFK